MKRILIAVVSILFLAPFISNIPAKAEDLNSLSRQELKMADQAMNQAKSISFVAWQNNPETIKKITTVAFLLEQAAQHYGLAAQYDSKVKQPINQDIQISFMQLEAETSSIAQQQSKLYLEMIPALQASDTSHVNQLALQINNLNQRLQNLNDKARQLAEISTIRKNQALQDAYVNSGRIFKNAAENNRCIYDTKPYGSESEVASNPSKYCNGH